MSQKLTRKQVGHVAKLANLPLTTKEVETFQGQLSEIVGYVEKVSGGKGSASQKRETIKLREDSPKSKVCLDQKKATSTAKNIHNGLFVVPAIFEEV